MKKLLLPAVVFFVITLPALLIGGIIRLLRNRPLRSFRKLSSVRNILIVRFDGVGDDLLTGGLASDLKRAYPGSRVAVVVDTKFVDFVRRLGTFDEVVGLDYQERSVGSTLTSVWRLLQFCRAHLWQRDIDLAINPRWDRDLREFGVVGYLSLCRSFVGYEMFRHNDKNIRNAGYSLFYSDLIPENGVPAHEIERHRDVVRFLGFEPSDQIPHIPLSHEDLDWARRELAANGRGRSLMILGIGSSTLRRTWPVERFVDVARAFPDFDCLVVGSGADGRVAEQILRPALGERLINYGGKCNLSRSAALASLGTVSIGNNSAVMHLAACAGVPVVDICGHPDGGDKFHDQSPIRFTAQYTRHVVVTPLEPADPLCAEGCISNKTHCIENIPASEVIDAAHWLLSTTGAGRSPERWYPLTLWSVVRKGQTVQAVGKAR